MSGQPKPKPSGAKKSANSQTANGNKEEVMETIRFMHYMEGRYQYT